MAVVSEPPWLNIGSGTAARNGTTSHTISFGFTSTSGNFLVVEIFGAVTHTASGWTEQLQPVSSGELSVFTKTSAGDSSITVTHNGSNYPVAWTVREYPAGSTWVTGAGDNDNLEAFDTLTGLPGVEVVVHAARGRTASSGSETGASASWGGSFIEDVDLYTPLASSTEGYHFTSGHQINVTATSSSPSATTTYTGTWSTPDREKVVYAIEVAASGSTINGTATVAGAGSVTAAAVQAVTAATTGAGTTSATVRQQAGSTVIGAGSTSATVVQRATATVAGAGTTSASSAGSTSGTATVAGLGSVTALAVQRTTAAPAGAGTVSAAGSVIVPGVASLTGAGAVAALVRQVAGASVAGAGQVTATSAGQIVAGTATVIGAGLVTASSSSRITPRPNTGTTTRPYAGITARP